MSSSRLAVEPRPTGRSSARTRRTAEIRITDFVLMALLPLRVGIDAGGRPLNELRALALAGSGLLPRPRAAGRAAGVPVVLLPRACWPCSRLSGAGQRRRLDPPGRARRHLARPDLGPSAPAGSRSARRHCGLAAGLVAVIGAGASSASVATTTPAGSPAILGDPNAGAYFIAVLGVLAIFFADAGSRARPSRRSAIVGRLVLTYSRTGLLALGLRRGLDLRRAPASGSRGRRAAWPRGLVWLVGNIPDDLSLFGPFSNRSGSDALRDRIIAQEHEQIASAPWYGNGPGTRQVNVRDREFFFHNSYLATRQEGGWPAPAPRARPCSATPSSALGHGREPGRPGRSPCQAAIIGVARHGRHAGRGAAGHRRWPSSIGVRRWRAPLPTAPRRAPGPPDG